ncbi:transposase [Streptomyces lavendulae]|uniref:transposase n=1 Tax=Streptomyces lavendulae TaxID=1914 RepID=UPI0024A3B6BD|nr:hypothetical protein Slala02_63110 [Streptomyces lavendulae subsp. lavendulae]
MAANGRGTWSWIVPDGLWEAAEPLVPPSKVRPQGGGTRDAPDETVFAAIVYVLVSGCAWRALPPCFGVSKSTVHRRFLVWSVSGLWGRLHEAVAAGDADGAELPALTLLLRDAARVRFEGAAPMLPAARGELGPARRLPRCSVCCHRPACPSSSVVRPAGGYGPQVPRRR